MAVSFRPTAKAEQYTLVVGRRFRFKLLDDLRRRRKLEAIAYDGVDAYAKKADTYFQEMLIPAGKVTRHCRERAGIVSPLRQGFLNSWSWPSPKYSPRNYGDIPAGGRWPGVAVSGPWCETNYRAPLGRPAR
jgi:hypothetical protein